MTVFEVKMELKSFEPFVSVEMSLNIMPIYFEGNQKKFPNLMNDEQVSDFIFPQISELKQIIS